MTCARCGGAMRWGRTTTRAGVTYDLYQCKGHRCRLAVLKDVAEEVATEWVATRLAFPTPDLLEATESERGRLAELNARRVELEADQRALDESSLSLRLRMKYAAEIDAERQKLERDHEATLRRVYLADMFSDLTLPKTLANEGIGGMSIRIAAEDIARRLTNAPLEKRQAVVRALVRVEVEPAHRGVRPTREPARQRIVVTPLNAMTGEPLHAEG